jgi:tRNA(fMet)-specific endonuclease VapC
MSHLLDTNICSAHLKRAAGLTHYFVQHAGRLFIPTPVLGELYTWAYHRKSSQLLLNKIENELLRDVALLDFDRACSLEFGRLNGQLLGQGRVVNPIDPMIAATALVHDLIVVTHNTRDFQNVPELRLEDWLQP